MRKNGERYHKTLYCSDFTSCRDGDTVFDLFLLSEAVLSSNERTRWLDLTLTDRTGNVHAKVWPDNLKPEYENLCGQIVLIKGMVSLYGGRPDLSVELMEVLEEGQFELGEVIRSLDEQKVEKYQNQIRKLLTFVEDQKLHTFVSNVLDQGMLNRMAYYPVRLTGHHSYRGGLLEHTAQVAIGVYYLLKYIKSSSNIQCDLGIALSGALLHDIPVSLLLQEDGYTFKKDRLHEISGTSYCTHSFLEGYRNQYWLDDKTYMLLLHVIEASHKGRLMPVCQEAMVVRNVNLLSADLELYEDAFQKQSVLLGEELDYVYSKDLRRELLFIRRESNEDQQNP